MVEEMKDGTLMKSIESLSETAGEAGNTENFCTRVATSMSEVSVKNLLC